MQREEFQSLFKSPRLVPEAGNHSEANQLKISLSDVKPKQIGNSIIKVRMNPVKARRC